jgi:hypothetical protein
MAEQNTQAASPLSEADPRSLDELMSRDPFKMTQRDHMEIITELRRMREVWAKAEAAGATKAPKAAKAAKPPAGPIDASDLGL